MIHNILLAIGLIVSEPVDTTIAAAVELESVTITSSQSDAMHYSSSELVLKMVELARFNVVDGNSLLQAQAGVYTQQEDGWGLRLNIGIRGSGVDRSSRITLMEDGILTAPAAYSAPAAYYSPVMWKYQQIEILKGGAALITGPQSTGGAINFVTPSPKMKDYHHLSFSGGSFAQLVCNSQGQVSVSKRSKLIYGIQRSQASGFNVIENERTGGFALNDGYVKWIQHLDQNDRHHLEVFVAGTTENSNQTYLGLTLEDALNDPNKRYLASALDQMKMERLMTRIGHTIRLKNGWFRTDLYRQGVHRNWYKLDKLSNGSQEIGLSTVLIDPITNREFFNALNGTSSVPYFALLKANNRNYISQGIQFRGQFSKRYSKLLVKHEVGSRFHYDHADRFQHTDTYLLSNDLPSLDQEGLKGASGNRIDVAQANSSFLRTTMSWNNWNLQAGLRGENIQSSRRNWGNSAPQRTGLNPEERSNQTFTLLPGISVSRTLGPWSIFTGIHRGMTPAGSKSGVLPELSTNTEIGFQHRSMPISLTVFHSEYQRLLGSDAASSGGSGSGELFNGGAARISGIEGNWTKTIGAWQIDGAATFTNAFFTESFSSEFEAWGEVKYGDNLPYIPILQGSGKLIYLKNRLTTGIQFQALSARKSASELDSYDLPAAVVANFSLSYTVQENITLQAGIQNIGNTRHIVAARPAGYRTYSPRMWTLGLDLSF